MLGSIIRELFTGVGETPLEVVVARVFHGESQRLFQ